MVVLSIHIKKYPDSKHHLAIVFETNSKFRHLPKIIVVKNQDNLLAKNVLVDLADVEKQTLEKTFLIKRALKDGAFGVFIKDYKEQGLALGWVR